MNEQMQSEFLVENTVEYWPNNSDFREKLSIPLALTISPTQQQTTNATFHDKNVQKHRCQSCKAFINKFCFIRSQNEYDCSICGCTNKIPQKKLDIRAPQLNSLSYKCRTLKTQRVITAKQRLFVFILDLTNYNSTSDKYLIYSIHVIRQFFKNCKTEKKQIKIMILGFEDAIHQFCIKGQIQRIQFCDQNSKSTECPFNQQQIGLLSECYQNLMLILDTLQNQIKQRNFRSHTASRAIMQVLQYTLKNTLKQSGKIFVISGLAHELQQFKVMRNYDSTIQDSFKNHNPIIKKQCLSEQLKTYLSSTQMSISMYFFNSNYINLTPFHIITKQTNGQLRRYFKAQIQHFFYQFNYRLQQCLYDMGFQTIIRVRYGAGLKMVAMFGNYRSWKNSMDQFQLLSCEPSRKYTFQFILQGKINNPFIIVQFSILYTDMNGNRFFKIITHPVKFSSQLTKIIPSINYNNVNFTYLRAILHNIDLTPNFRNLQLALQQRCKKHIKTIREMNLQRQDKKEILINNRELLQLQCLKNMKIYAIFTFLLMKHFLLNSTSKRDLQLDLHVEIRSKIATMDQGINIIWPILYAIHNQSYQIIEMKKQMFSKGEVGILIDRGDQIYLFIRDQQLRNSIRTSPAIRKNIKAVNKLQQIDILLDELQQKHSFPNLDILILDQNYLQNLNIFNSQGKYGFDAYISELISN